MLLRRRSPTLLTGAVVAFAAGIAGSAFFPCKSSFPLSASGILSVAVFLSWRKDHGAQHVLLLIFLLSCGFLHGSTHLPPPAQESNLYHLFATDSEATLYGTLLGAPSLSSDKTKLMVQVDGFITPDNIKQQRNGKEVPFSENPPYFLHAAGKIELGMKGPPPVDLLPGKKLLARARISHPTRYGTPGSFDYPAFLAQKSIYTTGWIDSPVLIKTLESPDNPSSLHKLRFLPEQIRHRVNRFLETALPHNQSSLYKAILTGDRAAVNPATLEEFKASGAIHLLAISGLHMGLIAIGLGLVINYFLRRSTWLLLHTSVWKIAALLTFPLLLCYALIAGFQVPVVRALIMTSVFLLAILFDRQWHVPTNIAIAALLILIIYPASLFTVSFQLSFAAVISIAAVLPQINIKGKNNDETTISPIRQKIYSALKGAVLLSCAATAGTLPLLLYYFNRFSTLSVFSTLLLEPLLCFWALSLGLISCPFIFFAPELSHMLLNIGAVGIQAADAINSRLAALPFSSVWMPTPTFLQIFAYYLLFFSLLFLKKKRPARITSAICLLLLAATPAFYRSMEQNSQADTVAILDVGQGNAVVVGLAGGGHVLIDGGGAYSDRFDAGRNIIAPYLWKKRITRLEGVVISHPDADHYNGLFFILERFKPRILWINGQGADGTMYAELLDRAKRLGIGVHVPDGNETLLQTEKSRLSNIVDYHRKNDITTDNGKSLVMRLDSQGRHFLFTGDIDRQTEKRLVEEGKVAQTDVLLLPHHGSNSSSSEEFLSAVSPYYGVISAGKRRKDRFPAAEVLKRCEEAGLTIYNTAVDGTITFSVKKGEISATTFAKNEEKFFNHYLLSLPFPDQHADEKTDVNKVTATTATSRRAQIIW